jgi:hypothetical protein
MRIYTAPAPQAKPELASLSVNNQSGLNLSGATGQTLVVDNSADLVNWTPLFTGD